MPQPLSNNIRSRVLNEEVSAGGSTWRLLIFMTLLFGVFLISYFGLRFGYTKFVSAKIAGAEQALVGLANQVPEDQQNEFLKFQFQLINLQRLLNQHVTASKIFPALEKNTNTQVYYTNFDLSVTEGKLKLQGVAKSYEVLAQQLAAFKKATEVSKYDVGGFKTLEGAEGVSFGVILYLKPEVFRSL